MNVRNLIRYLEWNAQAIVEFIYRPQAKEITFI